MKQSQRKLNTRKADCEICHVKTAAHHRVSCKWAYLPRPTKKAMIKRMTGREKIKLIFEIVKL